VNLRGSKPLGCVGKDALVFGRPCGVFFSNFVVSVWSFSGSAKANRDVRDSFSTTTGFPSGNAYPLPVPSGRHDESPVPSVWLKARRLLRLRC
jgi:hypothetical protein